MSSPIKNSTFELTEFALKKISSLKVDGAEISCARENGLSVSVRLGDVETVTHHLDQHFSVTVYSDHRTGSASSTDLSKPAITQAIEKAATIARYGNPDPFSGLPDKTRLATAFPDCDLSHDWNITTDEAIALATQCESLACQDKRITNSEGVSVSTFHSEIVIANTLGFTGSYPVSEHGISCSLVAKENNRMQRDYAYTVARNPNDLKSCDDIAQEASKRTIARLNPRPIKTQTCPVIFEAPVAKSLLRSFVQAISGGNLYRNSSFLQDAINKPVFPEFINIFQQPHIPMAMGSAPFDQEGVSTTDIKYVENGKLVSYALGSYSARKLGLHSTGNAGGVYNLAVSQSNLSFTELLKEMDTGLLVTDLMGQGVNITTGDYSRGASGFWVEKGEIQFPVEEITVAGNLKDIFQSIRAIANDTDCRGTIRAGSILINKMTIAGS